MTETKEPLIIRSLEFMGGMAAPGGWRPDPTMPEVAFAGRSNVGKSSLINKLVRRKAFARVSHTPGRTKEINFFEVNRRFMLVDLPGYGYARVSKAAKATWRPLIEGYLSATPVLAGVVQLLDVRHAPTDDDHVMLDFLAELGCPVIVVLTKVDKLGVRERVDRVAALGIQLQLDEEQVVSFSARTGEGRDVLAQAVADIVAAHVMPARSVAADAADATDATDESAPG